MLYRLCVFIGVIVVAVLVAQSADAQSSTWPYNNYYHRILLVHVSGGVAVPIGEDTGDEHDPGFDIGLGIGFLLSTGHRISPEVGFRFNFYRLPVSVPTDRYAVNESDNEYSYTIEGRFRYLTHSRIRPFGVGGVGLYDSAAEGSKSKFTATLGGGVDWAFDPKESVLLYGEFRLVTGPRNMLRFDLGVRIG